MNFPKFIADRIAADNAKQFSGVIGKLSVSAIALSVMVMLVAISILKGFQGEITEKITGFGLHIQIVSSKLDRSFENKPIYITEEDLAQYRSLPEVEHIQPFITKNALLKTKEAYEGLIVKGVDDDFNWDYFAANLQSGSIPSYESPADSNKILISSHMADLLKLEVGDQAILHFIQYPIRARKVEIAAIFKSGIDVVDEVFGIAYLPMLRNINGWQSEEVGGYELFVNDFEKISDVNQALLDMISYKHDTRTIKENYPQIFDWLGSLDVNVNIIIVLMIVVAVVNMTTALMINIFEKTKMIGLLKAFGAHQSSIRNIFLLHSIKQISKGMFWGNLLGLGILLLQHYFSIVHLDPETYYVNAVPVLFNWWYILLINIGTLVACTLAMLLPTLLVSRIDPIKIINLQSD